MGYNPVPLHPQHLLQYTAFLARSLKPSSIRCYLNIIGLLHKEFGLPNPLQQNWQLSSLLTGIKRTLGSPPRQTLPITIDLLQKLYTLLNLNSSMDASFWAICLVAFFGMFRKSHLLPSSETSFDPTKQLTKADFAFTQWGMLITIRWSKTIQFRERVVEIPLPRIPGSALCPVKATFHAFRFTCSSPSNSPAFLWSKDNGSLHIFTYVPIETSRTFNLA